MSRSPRNRRSWPPWWRRDRPARRFGHCRSKYCNHYTSDWSGRELPRNMLRWAPDYRLPTKCRENSGSPGSDLIINDIFFLFEKSEDFTWAQWLWQGKTCPRGRPGSPGQCTPETTLGPGTTQDTQDPPNDGDMYKSTYLGVIWQAALISDAVVRTNIYLSLV